MERADGERARMEQELELRLDLAEFFRNGRAKSKYARNLSAAARAGGISPSYLHRIERANTLASAECYAALCELYGLSRVWVFERIGKLDPDFERRLMAKLRTHWELLEAALSVRESEVGRVLMMVRGDSNESRAEESRETAHHA